MPHRLKRTLVAIVLIWTVSCASPATGLRNDPRVIDALAGSLDWLEQHPASQERTRLGNVGFDAWNWWLFSVWHPDHEIRERAAAETERRLSALTPPREWEFISLSYWVVLLRLAQDRGVAMRPAPPIPTGRQLAGIHDGKNPTTVWWIQQLLRHAGLPVDADGSSILLETAPADPAGYSPTVRDAYRVFHEIVPLSDLARAEFPLTPLQLEFIREALPGWIAAGRAKGDTDAVAETLVVAALIGERNTAYHDAIAWLLSRQRPDGTYVTLNPGATADQSRHAVLVASFALLSSLDRFEPRSTIAEPH